MPGVKRGIGNGVLAGALTGGYPGFGFAENTDAMFVGKSLLHGDVLMWLMKILLTSRCVNQLGAGQHWFGRCRSRTQHLSVAALKLARQTKAANTVPHGIFSGRRQRILELRR